MTPNSHCEANAVRNTSKLSAVVARPVMWAGNCCDRIANARLPEVPKNPQPIQISKAMSLAPKTNNSCTPMYIAQDTIRTVMGSIPRRTSRAASKPQNRNPHMVAMPSANR